MNQLIQQLIEQINTKLKAQPLFFFSREVERAIGLEDYLENYYIVCIEDNYITDQLKANQKNIYSANKERISIESNSTLELINTSTVQDYIKSITKGNSFYVQLFQFNKPIELKVKGLNGKLVNNPSELNRFFEDKFNQYAILKENNITIPKGIVIDSSKTNYAELAVQLGNSFVIQLDRAHTGSGTFFISATEDWEEFSKNYNGNTIKATELIEGEAYTINACITKKGTFISGLQYQITGYSELTPGRGSTVGNDWSYGSSQLAAYNTKLQQTVNQIAEIMKDKGYKGLFGIDFIINDKGIFVIEINARQTANIPMQTRLELQADLVPLSLLHLAEFLDIEIPIQPSEIKPLEGSQVFLRAKNDSFKINFDLKGGIYRLQSDDSSIDWQKMQLKEGVIQIDENGDKPLVWQRDGYSIDNIDDGGFVMLTQKAGTLKNKFEEILRMQFKNGVIKDNNLAPWILEAMVAIENIIK